ncbi:MAG: ABC-F family ATP-binding cassette domain-containing protein [Candidatus Gracilibacteria bacterium]|jgi:ATP-binding cassette subfamily F protein 3|nr:ABC-F family ATP-binding cassette domain-containing protein [Candidatus Gracilibacteria bacterium]
MATLLQITGLHKSYGSHVILDGASFTVSEKQKIAVVGRNGAGKSTLFKIIVGEEDLTEGDVKIFPGTKIGYLTQNNPYGDEDKVMDFLMKSSKKEDFVCAKVAGQFQIKTDLFDRKISSLPGGYQMRLKLVSMLLEEPNLLLLDEPTNYLDLSTQLLLEKFLKNYKAAFLLISHDREFIKKTCNQTLEIDQGKTFLFPQSIEEYLAYKVEKIASTEKANQKIEVQKQHLQKFVDRFKAKASKATQAKSKMKQIQKLKTIEIVNPISTSKIRIPKVEDKKGVALIVDDLAIGYPEKKIADKIFLEIERGEHIAIVGDNGQGKTTFLKTIAGELCSISGKFKWGANIQIGYYAQHTPMTLDNSDTVKGYLERTAPEGTKDRDIFEMAGNFLFKDDALKKQISVLSGGERARLCLASMLLNKNSVLLLDEPTNHLDFETVEALAGALKESTSTILFISHNRTFVDALANGIVEVKNGKVTRFHHNYEEYVYLLNKDIDNDLSSLSKGVVLENSENGKKQKNREKIKEITRKIRKLEAEMKKLEEEKFLLLSWFEKNFKEFSPEKNKRLSAINDLLAKKEGEWLLLQVDLEQ